MNISIKFIALHKIKKQVNYKQNIIGTIHKLVSSIYTILQKPTYIYIVYISRQDFCSENLINFHMATYRNITQYYAFNVNIDIKTNFAYMVR